MLGTPRARANGPAFLVGWLVGLPLVGLVVLLVAGSVGADDGGEPATWVGRAEARVRPDAPVAGGEAVARAPAGRRRAAKVPKWMASVDRSRRRRRPAIGVVLSAANPKNLVLAADAQPPRSRSPGSPPGKRPRGYAVFVLVGTLGVAARGRRLLRAGRARAVKLLDELKTLDGVQNNAVDHGRAPARDRREADRGRDLGFVTHPAAAGSSPRCDGYGRRWLRGDVIAGLTVWAVLVPEALAYASIAGVSPVVGLYAAPGALILYAAFGSSRHLVTGPMAATAALSAAAVGDLAARRLRRVPPAHDHARRSSSGSRRWSPGCCGSGSSRASSPSR